jgi:hypothetical protein
VTLFSPDMPAASRSRVKVDWADAIGLGLWVTFMVVALAEGPSDGWDTPVVIGFGAAGVVLFVVWIVQERLAEVPLMSFDRMDLRQTLVGYSGLAFMGVVGNVLFIGVPNMLQTSRNLDGAWVSLHSAPRCRCSGRQSQRSALPAGCGCSSRA